MSQATATATGIERRAHPRRKISAPVEIREAITGQEVNARLIDVSRGGCFVETQSPLPVGTATEVVIAKAAESFQALAKVVSILPNKGMGLEFTVVGAAQFRILGAWLDKSLQNLWLGTGRQRGQRVPLRVPVRVSGYTDDGARLAEDTYTSEVNAHGGSILLSAPVKEGQRLVLSHLQTKAAIECLVVSCKVVEGNRLLVGVAFVLPNPRFWLVSFPPAERSLQQADPLRNLASGAFGQTRELCLQF
jgi:hypothetical protein